MYGTVAATTIAPSTSIAVPLRVNRLVQAFVTVVIV